jgi:hypothetical protein
LADEEAEVGAALNGLFASRNLDRGPSRRTGRAVAAEAPCGSPQKRVVWAIVFE